MGKGEYVKVLISENLLLSFKIFKQKLIMHWKTWLLFHAPKDWSIQEKLQYINLDCPNVKMEDLSRAIAAHNEINKSNIALNFKEEELNQINQEYEDSEYS